MRAARQNAHHRQVRRASRAVHGAFRPPRRPSRFFDPQRPAPFVDDVNSAETYAAVASRSFRAAAIALRCSRSFSLWKGIIMESHHDNEQRRSARQVLTPLLILTLAGASPAARTTPGSTSHRWKRNEASSSPPTARRCGTAPRARRMPRTARAPRYRSASR